MNYQVILTILPYYFSFSIYKPSKFESKSTNFKKVCIPFSLVFFSLFHKKITKRMVWKENGTMVFWKNEANDLFFCTNNELCQKNTINY